MSVFALIPARGGSKGLKDKNILPLCGRPLIAHTISSALDSVGVDRVFVSTDSPTISGISERWGAEVPFLRPAHLANDTASTEAVIGHFIDWVGLNLATQPDLIVLLQPTCPIRSVGLIDRAICALTKGSFDSVLSVKPYRKFLWNKADNGLVPSYDVFNRPRRQEINSCAYEENGNVYVFKTAGFLEQKNRLFGKIGFVECTEMESIDIDTGEDFAVAEAFLSLAKAK